MEAAGLVLGVIPLAIKALNTYLDILSTIKNVRRDLEYMIRDLRTEHQILQNTCETLLRGIAPDSVLDSMIEDPFGPAWSKYNDEVRLRLWRSADVFQERVAEMRQAAVDLQQKLGVDPDGKTHFVDRHSIMKGLRHSAYFTLKKKDYNEIMSRIKGGNAVLNTLANQNSSLEPTRRSRAQAKLARLVRNLSQRMYGAFQNVITCSCPSSHNLGLEMLPRRDIMLPGDEEEEVAQSLDFSVVIGSQEQKKSQRWDKVRVKLAPKEIALPSTPPTTPSPDLPRSRSPRVRWSIRTPQTTVVVSNKTDQHASQLSVSFQGHPALQPLAITNLCHVLHKGKGNATVQDYCGVLHLYNTSWLARTFTTDDIVLIMEQQAADAHGRLMGRPFLAKVLPKLPATSCRSAEQATVRPMDLTILSLGLVLIQIIIGQHVEGLAIDPDNKGMDSIISKQEAASQMTRPILENGGMNYADAVQWCLGSVLSVACLDDEAVGQEFYEAVIARLEADMRQQASMDSTA
ncbi:hypothetical protein LA080_001979 [Diaporthe eres]|nr:hypothetical protein LA080_001979 [Diaporthe eres]